LASNRENQNTHLSSNRENQNTHLASNRENQNTLAFNRENQNTHFAPNNFFVENLAVYEIMWRNITDDNMADAHYMLET